MLVPSLWIQWTLNAIVLSAQFPANFKCFVRTLENDIPPFGCEIVGLELGKTNVLGKRTGLSANTLHFLVDALTRLGTLLVDARLTKPRGLDEKDLYVLPLAAGIATIQSHRS